MSDKVCYRCGSSHVTKNGITAKGYQRYRCRDCGRSFHCESEYVGTSSRHEQSSSSSFSSENRSSFGGVSSYHSTQTISSAPQQPAPESKPINMNNNQTVVSAPETPKKILKLILNSPDSFTFKAINFVRWLFVVAGFLLGLLFLGSGNFLFFLFMVLSAVVLSPAIDNKISFLSNQKTTKLISQIVCSFILFIVSFYFIK